MGMLGMRCWQVVAAGGVGRTGLGFCREILVRVGWCGSLSTWQRAFCLCFSLSSFLRCRHLCMQFSFCVNASSTTGPLSAQPGRCSCVYGCAIFFWCHTQKMCWFQPGRSGVQCNCTPDTLASMRHRSMFSTSKHQGVCFLRRGRAVASRAAQFAEG